MLETSQGAGYVMYFPVDSYVESALLSNVHFFVDSDSNFLDAIKSANRG